MIGVAKMLGYSYEENYAGGKYLVGNWIIV